MAEKNGRIEIPQNVAAELLFLADRTCCVCRQRLRPIQIHHIDDDPTNSVIENLLGDHFKSGQRVSVQNRPTDGGRDVTVVPCQGLLRQV